MGAPEHLPDNEGELLDKHRSLRALLWITVLLYLGLLLYLKFAPQPNLMLVNIWFAGPSVALSLMTILPHRPLTRHHAPGGVHSQTNDTN